MIRETRCVYVRWSKRWQRCVWLGPRSSACVRSCAPTCGNAAPSWRATSRTQPASRGKCGDLRSWREAHGLIPFDCVSCREKTEIQERLAQVETQRQAKELALAKLQSDYEEMRHVAAQAQMRVEKYAVQKDSAQHDRRVNSLLGNKENLYLGRGVSVGKAATSNHQLPETSRFFQEHNRPQETKAMDSVEHDETANQQNQQRSSNVAALEAMKRKMVADIQRQIELTKYAFFINLSS